MRKLSVATKFAYGVGQAGEQIKTTGFNIFVFFYFQQVLGLSGSLAGTAVLIALAFDAVTDPLAGSLSDHWKSPRGRRHPFMYASAAPLAVTWYLLFFPPPGLGQMGLFLWLTTFAILVRGAMTLYHVPHLALGAELTSDYEERTSVVSYRVMCGMLGGISVSVLGIRLFFPETPEYGNGLLDPAGYPKVALFGAIAMAVTIWYSAWGTRKQIPHLPKAPDGPDAFSLKRIGGEFRSAWHNPSFRALFVGFSCFAVSIGIITTLGTHINVYYWEFPTEQIAILPIPFALGFVVGVAISGALHRRFDKKPTLVFATVVAAFTGHTVVVLRLLEWIPENGDPLILLLVVGFALAVGTAAGIGYTSAGSMMADVASDQEARTGERQQGLLFAAVSFSSKLASGLGHFAAGIGIDLIAFPAQADPGQVPVELVRRLGILQLSALFFSVLGILTYAGYRIDRGRHAEVLRALGARTESAELDV